MKDEEQAHLHDIVQAGRAIQEFIGGCTFEEYVSNAMMRSAVERKFEIMGGGAQPHSQNRTRNPQSHP